jgi:molybdate transport system substrate-binding protein
MLVTWEPILRQLLAILLLLGSCSGRPAVEPILVFSAASCADVLTAQAKEFGPEKLSFNFASSALLARQVEQGAPAKIILTANQEWMQYLVEKGKVTAENQQRLIGNCLVLIGTTTTPSLVLEPGARFPAGRLALADPSSVPAGIYAKQALVWLGHWSSLESRIITAADVRAALNLVRIQEADLGIVYASDLRGSTGVKVLAEFPRESHEPIEYYIGMVGQPEQATRELYRYLIGEKAKETFLAHGFKP